MSLSEEGLHWDSIEICAATLKVWRVSFALGAIPLAFMIYYRIFRLRESAVWVKRTDATNSRGADMALLFKW